ncbi:MAG: HD domain-containing protein [Lachnospiraceae bacterium]|nr:HD domain-containing protein [Lachnospiraceae bacterium]
MEFTANKFPERLQQQMDFIREMDKTKQIIRQTYLTDGSRKEGDAEHAWHLALMVMLLQEYAQESIDVAKTMSMVLIHDLVEIDAGDTYAYDTEGNKTQRERELKAADRIFSLLPKDQGGYLRSLWDEFEEGQTPEAKFARTMDRIQPMMQNDASNGKAWKEHEVYLDQIMDRNKVTHKGSEILWDYALETYIKPNVERNIIKTRSK